MIMRVLKLFLKNLLKRLRVKGHIMGYDTYIEAKESGKEFIAWGGGLYLKKIYSRFASVLNIVNVCDSNSDKWGKKWEKTELICIAPEELKAQKNAYVLISVQDQGIAREIGKKLEEWKMSYCHINDVIESCQREWENIEIQAYDEKMKEVEEPEQIQLIKRFVSVSVPIEACNLRCKYCYIGQTDCFHKKEIIYFSPAFIRRALSRKRLGGTALINFCGVGETLLCKEVIPIIQELLEEGHYISIITNALLTEEIRRLVGICEEYNARLFFKCSFHYRQLVDKNLLDRYVSNINLIKKSGASYSIELVPEDELIPMIEDIKEFSIKYFGALPHVTVARDEGKQNIPILTSLSQEEYRNIWGQFESPMFMLKMEARNKQDKFCYAGDRTFLLALDSGDILPCPFHECIGNIYENISEQITFSSVGKHCKAPYCINGHAYLTLGILPEVNVGTYLEMRDRQTTEGKNWVQPKMADFINQRICDNY